MRPIQCDQGHYYDADKYEKCPHCDKQNQEGIQNSNKLSEENKILETNEDHEEKKRNTIKPSAVENLLHTVAIAPESEVNEKNINKIQDPKTVAIDISTGDSVSVELNDNENFFNEEIESKKEHQIPEDGKTQIISGLEVDPVVGFLICIEGPHFGECFCIYEGKNSIGRSINSRIQLNKDQTVSRKAQAYIIFDSMNNSFLITSGESDALAYVNNQLILQPVKVEINTDIKVGQCILRFIPFINENFTWKEYLKEDR